MNHDNNKADLKRFFIKLVAITLSVIVIINVTYNLIFADKIESINMILNLDKKENIELMKDKIRIEINRGLKKDKILNDEDKILLHKLYKKLQKEFQDLETN